MLVSMFVHIQCFEYDYWIPYSYSYSKNIQLNCHVHFRRIFGNMNMNMSNIRPSLVLSIFTVLGNSLNSLDFQSSFRGSYPSAVAKWTTSRLLWKIHARGSFEPRNDSSCIWRTSGSNEGGIGHVSLGVNFRLSEGTVTNHIYDVSIKVHRFLKYFNLIVWQLQKSVLPLKNYWYDFLKSSGSSTAQNPPLAAKGHNSTRSFVRWPQTCAYIFYSTVEGRLWSLNPYLIQRGGGKTWPRPIWKISCNAAPRGALHRDEVLNEWHRIH
jgi:hypothetical protein